jgi:hypothetical protein
MRFGTLSSSLRWIGDMVERLADAVMVVSVEAFMLQVELYVPSGLLKIS